MWKGSGMRLASTGATGFCGKCNACYRRKQDRTMIKPLVLDALVLVGCSESPNKKEAESDWQLLAERQWAHKPSTDINTIRTKEESLRKVRKSANYNGRAGD
jgi:hypothetical protein